MLVFLIALVGIFAAAPLQAIEWQKEIVAQGGAKPSLAVGADGTPGVAFMFEAMPGFVSFAEKREGLWVIEQVASGYFYRPLDVIMDGANPVINYHDHDLEDQVVARRGESGWTHTPIQSSGHDGWDNTLGIDPAGVLHTLTTDPIDFGGPGLEYVSLVDGTWRVEEVGTGPIMYAEGLSMTFAPDGVPHISYHNTPERSLYHGERKDGVWQLTRVDGGPDAGMFSSVSLASDGSPRISYVKFTEAGAEIRLASLETGVWSSERVDVLTDLTVGFAFARNATRLRIDPGGDAFIAYSGETEVKLARKTAEGWEIEVVDTIADNTGTRFGEQVDLEQDPSGQWHLVTFEVLTPSPLSGNILYYRTTP